MQAITIQKQADILHLSGVLNCATLKQLWHNKHDLLSNVNSIDVSSLTRVDSSGLALLTYFCIQNNVKLIAINQQLKTLIDLYDLDAVLA